MIWWPWLKGRVVTWPVSGFISMVIGCAVRPCGRSWWVATSAKVCTAWVASCWPILGICDQKKKPIHCQCSSPNCCFFVRKKILKLCKMANHYTESKIYDWSCLTYLKVSFTDLILIATLFMLYNLIFFLSTFQLKSTGGISTLTAGQTNTLTQWKTVCATPTTCTWCETVSVCVQLCFTVWNSDEPLVR